MGLTRDSALWASLRATTWCLLICNVVGARPSVDFATHGFAEVAVRVNIFLPAREGNQCFANVIGNGGRYGQQRPNVLGAVFIIVTSN